MSRGTTHTHKRSHICHHLHATSQMKHFKLSLADKCELSQRANRNLWRKGPLGLQRRKKGDASPLKSFSGALGVRSGPLLEPPFNLKIKALDAPYMNWLKPYRGKAWLSLSSGTNGKLIQHNAGRRNTNLCWVTWEPGCVDRVSTGCLLPVAKGGFWVSTWEPGRGKTLTPHGSPEQNSASLCL